MMWILWYMIMTSKMEIFSNVHRWSIDSNKEYVNKHLWLKYLLEDIEVNDAQKIADIIIGEAIDNDFGNQKDDMSVIVAKVTKKQGK